MRKGPEQGAPLAHSKESKEASVAGEEGQRGRCNDKR